MKADHYLFCGNGEHGNPERRAVEMLFAEIGDMPVTLHFTYAPDEIDRTRKQVALDHGGNWDSNSDGLDQLIKSKIDAGLRVSVNTPTDRKGVRIDLLESISH